MNIRYIPRFLQVLSVAATLLWVPIQSAKAVDLPTGSCGLGSGDLCLTFDDFDVYSLSLLQELQNSTYDAATGGSLAGLDFVAKPNEATVLITETDGNGTTAQGTGTSIDDPFRAMTGNDDNMRFLMSTPSLTTGGPSNDIPNDPDGTGTWDNLLANPGVVNSDTFTLQPTLGPNNETKFADSNCFADMNNSGCMQLWDADISALRTALNGDDMVFLFNNNETGDSGELLGQDLVVWAKVTLHSLDGLNSKEFVLSGNNTISPLQFDSQVQDESDILPTANDLWAHVHSDICVEQDASNLGAVFLGDCADAALAGFINGKQVNQSLGVDEAGFAAFNQELSDLINGTHVNSALYDVLTIDLRFAYLNDGGDTLWIAGTDVDNPGVPVPATVFLLGAGLLGLRLFRFKEVS